MTDEPRPRCGECFTRLRDGETQRDHNREARRPAVSPSRYPND